MDLRLRSLRRGHDQLVLVSLNWTREIAVWCWRGCGQPSVAIRGRNCYQRGEETLLGPPSEPQTEVRKPTEANSWEVNPFFRHLHLAKPNMESSGKKPRNLVCRILAPAWQGRSESREAIAQSAWLEQQRGSGADNHK